MGHLLKPASSRLVFPSGAEESGIKHKTHELHSQMRILKFEGVYLWHRSVGKGGQTRLRDGKNPMNTIHAPRRTAHEGLQRQNTISTAAHQALGHIPRLQRKHISDTYC